MGFGNSNVNDNSTQPTFGERLALIAQVIVTIGDILTTVSIGLQIEEGIEEAKSETKEKKEQDQLLTKMQDQIDSLQKEISILKKNQS